MKTINFLRGQTGLQAFFPTVSKNVQEVQPVHKAMISVTSEMTNADRPNLLSKRSARWARRSTH